MTMRRTSKKAAIEIARQAVDETISKTITPLLLSTLQSKIARQTGWTVAVHSDDYSLRAFVSHDGAAFVVTLPLNG